MVNEPKRIDIQTSLSGVNFQTIARFGPGTGNILRRLTNYHNIWAGLMVEPETADANAHGLWVLWQKSNTNVADTDWTLANLQSDNFNMQVIACGLWGASNQTPYNMQPLHLNSSRNMVANQELVFTCKNLGQTAGNSRIVVSLCAGVAVK